MTRYPSNLDFVQPIGPGWWPIGKRRLVGQDEARRLGTGSDLSRNPPEHGATDSCSRAALGTICAADFEKPLGIGNGVAQRLAAGRTCRTRSCVLGNAAESVRAHQPSITLDPF